MNGPLLVKNCEVLGFRVGIKTGHSVNSQTFESIRLLNQTETGFINEGQSIAVRDLVSQSGVPAIKSYGTFALIDATLQGSASAAGHPAVLNFNGGEIYLRNVVSSGIVERLRVCRRLINRPRIDCRKMSNVRAWVQGLLSTHRALH